MLKYSRLPGWRIFAVPATDPMDVANIAATEKLILAPEPVGKKSRNKMPGIGKPDGLHNNFQEALPYPALNIRSLIALYPGKEACTLIPGNTGAEINISQLPYAYPDKLINMLENLFYQPYAYYSGSGYV